MEMVTLREVFDFAHHRITLLAPDGSIMRHDTYTADTMPVHLFRGGERTYADTAIYTYEVPSAYLLKVLPGSRS